MAMSLRVVVPPHPLIAHWLTILRDASTPSPLCVTAMVELGRWLTYEAVREWLPQRQVSIQTPLASSEGVVIDGTVPVLAVAWLPAGLGLWEGARTVLPAAALAPITAKRGSREASLNTATDAPAGDWIIEGLPESIAERVGVLLLVPQIASADDLLAVLARLRQLGVSGQRLRLITLISAAAGLKSLGEKEPDLTIYCACIDAELDAHGRPLPGFGDADRRFTGIDGVTCLS